MLCNKTVSRNSSEQIKTSKSELYSLFCVDLRGTKGILNFLFLTEKYQTIISDDKLVMKETAAVIDLSMLFLHMAMS